MQKWDYLVIQCYSFRPDFNPYFNSQERIIYESKKGTYGKEALDPAFDWPTFDNRSQTWRIPDEWILGTPRGKYPSAPPLAWLPSRKYWTHLWKCLEDMGEEGWELVGTTPPLSLPYGGSSHGSASHDPVDFCLLFKRPRP